MTSTFARRAWSVDNCRNTPKLAEALRVLLHQIWSSWNSLIGLVASEANKGGFFSEEPGENQLFHVELNTQGWPTWINTRTMFAWAGESGRAEFLHQFYKLSCFLCSVPWQTNRDLGTQLLQWIRGFDCELLQWPTGQAKACVLC